MRSTPVHGLAPLLLSGLASARLIQAPECVGIRISDVHSDFRIITTTASELLNYSSEPGFDFCNVTATITHPHANDVVYTGVWLPLASWNGRFVATGGGGLMAGFESSLPSFAKQGYALAYTDAGLTLNNTIDPATGAWAITSPGHLNNDLIKNFAYRSIHDMTVLSKTLIKSFYGTPPAYSYYSGCATGGRMGYFAAEHFPGDFDGILAQLTCHQHTAGVSSRLLASVVMANIVAPPQCVFDAYLEAVDCSSPPDTIVITAEHEEVVETTLQGATSSSGEFLWYGLAPGAPFSGLANTVYANGSVTLVPFSSAQNWIAYLVDQDPDTETASPSFAEFDAAFQQSVTLFSDILGTDSPDLTDFKRSGGKLLTFQGLADPLITHWGTAVYHDRLQKAMDGVHPVDDFYRVFLAPGVGHCGGGAGPNPIDPLGALKI